MLSTLFQLRDELKWRSMSTGTRLKWLRTNAIPKPLRQIELAQKLGHAQSWVSAMERNANPRISPDDLAEWAEACGYVGVTVFLPLRDQPPELGATLASADPASLEAITNVLRSLGDASEETRSALLKVLQSFSG